MKPLLIVSLLLISLSLIPLESAPPASKKGGKKPPSAASTSAAGGAAAGGAAAGGAAAATGASTLHNPTAGARARQRGLIVWANNGYNVNLNSAASPNLAARLRSTTGIIAMPVGVVNSRTCPARPANRQLHFAPPLRAPAPPGLPPLLPAAPPVAAVHPHWPVAIWQAPVHLALLGLPHGGNRLILNLPPVNQQQAPLPPVQGVPGVHQVPAGPQQQQQNPPLPAAQGHLPGGQQPALPAVLQHVPAPPLHGAALPAAGLQPVAQLQGGAPLPNGNLSPQLAEVQAARRLAYMRIQAALQHEVAEAAEAEAAAAAAAAHAANPIVHADDDAALRNARPALPTLDEQEEERRVAANALFQQQQMAAAHAAEDGGHVQDGDRGAERGQAVIERGMEEDVVELVRQDSATGSASDASGRSERADMDIEPQLQNEQRDADRAAWERRREEALQAELRGDQDNVRRRAPNLRPLTLEEVDIQLQQTIGRAVTSVYPFNHRGRFRQLLRMRYELLMPHATELVHAVEVGGFLRGVIFHSYGIDVNTWDELRRRPDAYEISEIASAVDVHGRQVVTIRMTSQLAAMSIDPRVGIVTRAGRATVSNPLAFNDFPASMDVHDHPFRANSFEIRLPSSALFDFMRIVLNWLNADVRFDMVHSRILCWFNTVRELITAAILIQGAIVDGVQCGVAPM